MTQFISDIVYSLFKDNAWLGVMVLAAIPITELKASIPFALSKDIWGLNVLGIKEAYFFSYLGSIIPVFFIVLLMEPIFKLLKKFKFTRIIVEFFEDKFKRLGEKINKKLPKRELDENFESLSDEEKQLVLIKRKRKSDIFKFLGILSFVAIPLPLTGVWTGSAIASILKLKPWLSIPAILIGNAIAGVFIMLACVIFGSYLMVFYIIVSIFLLVALFSIAISIIKRIKKSRAR